MRKGFIELEETRKQAKEQLTKSLDTLKILDNTNFDLNNHIQPHTSLWDILNLKNIDHQFFNANKYNIFQIFPVYNNKCKINGILSLNATINNIIQLAIRTDKNLNHADISVLNNVLIQFYYDSGIFIPRINENPRVITNLDNNQWLTLNDFRFYLDRASFEASHENLGSNTQSSYRKLIMCFEDLDVNYGSIINGHTSKIYLENDSQNEIFFRLVVNITPSLTKQEFINKLLKCNFLGIDIHKCNMDITYDINKLFEPSAKQK